MVKLDNNKKENIFLGNLEEFEQTLRFKGAINTNSEIRKGSNIIEQLGFTTSINSILKDIEQDGTIKIHSSISPSQNLQAKNQFTNFGILSPNSAEQVQLNPVLKRIKLFNNTLLRILLAAIIINFILILLL